MNSIFGRWMRIRIWLCLTGLIWPDSCIARKIHPFHTSRYKNNQKITRDDTMNLLAKPKYIWKVLLNHALCFQYNISIYPVTLMNTFLNERQKRSFILVFSLLSCLVFPPSFLPLIRTIRTKYTQTVFRGTFLVHNFIFFFSNSLRDYCTIWLDFARAFFAFTQLIRFVLFLLSSVSSCIFIFFFYFCKFSSFSFSFV